MVEPGSYNDHLKLSERNHFANNLLHAARSLAALLPAALDGIPLALDPSGAGCTTCVDKSECTNKGKPD
jgi:hypothetical protein